MAKRTIVIVEQQALRPIADGLQLRIGPRLTGGEFGAYEARTNTGVRVVVKVLPGWLNLAGVRRAADLAESLRADGYPAPRYLAVEPIDDSIATVQEFVSGDVPTRLSAELVTRMLELWRRHRDAATNVSAHPEAAHDELTTDFRNGIAQADELLARLDDPPVAHVIRRSRELLTDYDLDAFRSTDIVHNDFHHANLLVRDGEIVAVIDWENATVGDGRADVLRLYAASVAADRIDRAGGSALEVEVERIPPQIRLPLAARKAIGDLGFAVDANPTARDWALTSARLMLGDAVLPTW